MAPVKKKLEKKIKKKKKKKILLHRKLFIFVDHSWKLVALGLFQVPVTFVQSVQGSLLVFVRRQSDCFQVNLNLNCVFPNLDKSRL